MQRPPPKVRKGQSVEEAATEIQRELLENLRRNLLSSGEREYLAAQLERFWFPSSKAVKDGRARGRATIRQWWAELYRREIDHIAATERISKADAKIKVAEKYELQSVDASTTTKLTSSGICKMLASLEIESISQTSSGLASPPVDCSRRVTGNLRAAN
jgi:hypothetical protein